MPESIPEIPEHLNGRGQPKDIYKDILDGGAWFVSWDEVAENWSSKKNAENAIRSSGRRRGLSVRIRKDENGLYIQATEG